MASDALISLVVDQLVSYAQQQVTQVTGAREEVGKLTITLKIIQGVLVDAEEKQVQKNAVKVWLAELKDVLYAADDVLDEWHTKTAISKLQTGDVDVNMASASTRKKVLSFLFPICHCLKDVTMRYDIGGQIKVLRVRLDVIAKEREQYALVASSSHSEPPSITTLTSSIIDDVSGIRGRVGDKQTILGMLLSDTSCQGRAPIYVISIVGTGGFGKTTLAKLVFNDKNVEMTFEKRMWVCVSQPFDFLKIAKDIIEQATGHVPDFHGLEALHQHLSDSVKEKKFLLILDDVWTENPEHWTPLNSSLSGGSSGSRIIVTTRNKEVAMMMGSTRIHDLKVLSGEDSWSLLSHVALKEREHDLHKFEKIGREIACKCKGVPLAIQIVARFLCHKRLIQEWRDVANNNLWEMSKIKEFFLPSVLISYNSLSPISKQCFLFCAVFPKDTVMSKSELVLLWMANGFFGYEGNNELEKRGEHHFDILAMRSFFQDFLRDSDGVIICCKMHDLVHDFAQFLSQDECFIDDGNGGEFNASKVRHLWMENFDDKLYMAKNLRTVMGLGRNIVPHIGKLVCLRTLDLSWCVFEELPSGVCRLLHLRYLDLSYNSNLFELPEEVCNLYNLQTLKLEYCHKLRKLPERIGDLSNLRHLDLKGTDELTYLPRGIARLILLRTLRKFIVGELNTTECKIGDLKHLTKLEGELQIKGLGRIKDGNEAAEAELNKMNAINSLKLWFGRGDDDPVGINTTANSVLEKLEPPEYLEKLAIYSHPGDRFPGWMHDSLRLSNIVEIELSAFDNCTQLPPLGNLGSLETLKIIFGFRRVKRVGPEFFGGVSFPKMRSLYLQMSELEELNMIPPFLQEEEGASTTTRIIIMPNLRELTIDNCDELTKLKVVTPYYMFSPTLERMDISFCPLLEKLFSGGDEGVSSSDPLPLNNPQLAQPPPYSSLRTLNIMFCESLDFDLKDLQQFSNLQHMNIFECPHLEKRFQGEEWRSICSHVPRITFNLHF